MIRQFPDIELALVQFLTPLIAGTVCTELPPAMSTPTVHIQKIGGVNSDIAVDKPIVDIDVYDVTRQQATDLSRQIQNLILFTMNETNIPGAVVSGGKTVIGPRWLPYDDTTLRRVSGSYLINIHAA